MANLSRTLSAEQVQHLIRAKTYFLTIIKDLNHKKIDFNGAFDMLWNTKNIEVHSRLVDKTSFGIDYLNIRTRLILKNGIWELAKTCEFFYSTRDKDMKETLANLTKSKSKRVRVTVIGEGPRSILNITVLDCNWPA